MTLMLEEVKKTTCDSEKIKEMYDYFFTSGRVRNFLKKREIVGEELDEILSKMEYQFMINIIKYKDDKISLQVWIWKIINYTFLNYMNEKLRQFKKIDSTVDVELIIHTGSLDDQHFEIDIQIISGKLSDDARLVFLSMVDGYHRKDMNVVGLTTDHWDDNRIEIQDVMIRHGYGSKKQN